MAGYISAKRFEWGRSELETLRRWTSRNVLILAICLLVILAIGGGLFAAYRIRESTGREQFVAKVKELREAGQPVDNADLEAIYADKTDDTNTTKWLSLFDQAKEIKRAAKTDGVYSLDPKSVYAPFVATGSWPYDEATRVYLQPFQPLLDQTRELAKERKSVRFPKRINSYMTDMRDIDNVRIIARALSLDGLMCIRDRQGDRLVEDVTTLYNLAETIENEPLIVGSLVSIACDNVATQLVKDAVVADVLSQSQLVSLQERLLEEVEHVPPWKKIIREERATMIPAFFDPSVLDDSHSVPQSAPMRGRDGLKYLELMAKAEAVNAEDLSQVLAVGKQIRTETDALQRSVFGMYDKAMTALLLPDFDLLGQSLIRCEHDVRLATYGTACRLYMLEHGKAPDTLNVLKLPHQNLMLVGGKPPGYQVTADGDSLLWFFDLEKTDSTPAEPPPPKYPESLAPELFTWTIPLKPSLNEASK